MNQIKVQQFQEKMNNFTAIYKEPQTIKSNDGEFTIKIIEVKNERLNGQTFQSKFIVESIEKSTKLTNTYQLRTNKMPSQFNYALGAKDDHCALFVKENGQKKCNKGNVFIHGPASIEDDM